MSQLNTGHSPVPRFANVTKSQKGLTAFDTTGSIYVDEMDIARIKERIDEIAGRRKHVRFSELTSLLDNHIGPLYANYNHYGSPHHAFTVGQTTFNIAEPKQGFVKKVYVEQFLAAMQAAGLFDPEEER